MKERTFVIIENTPIAKDTFRMDLACLDPAFFKEVQPGQFLHIRVPNAALSLRRPISVCDICDGSLKIAYVVKGEGTKSLAKAKPGTELVATGPIGRGFPIEGVKKTRLLGGGIGVAPLLFLARCLRQSGAQVDAFLGFRSAEYAILAEGFSTLGCEVRLFSDDGTIGRKGFAVDGLIAQGEDSPVFACGPKPMFQALQRALPPSTPAFVSLEERMGCGVGACLGCAVGIRVENGIVNRRVCVDGPVFPLSEVVL
ncbi:MAG: dihydroorotate dehydrogenase electron transfer subunit [Christensenellales bacterium]|jgi:dihydroorotate dehydrogenase electron transfer subunit